MLLQVSCDLLDESSLFSCCHCVQALTLRKDSQLHVFTAAFWLAARDVICPVLLLLSCSLCRTEFILKCYWYLIKVCMDFLLVSGADHLLAFVLKKGDSAFSFVATKLSLNTDLHFLFQSLFPLSSISCVNLLFCCLCSQCLLDVCVFIYFCLIHFSQTCTALWQTCVFLNVLHK